MYTSEEDWELRHPSEPYPKGVADIIVAKHRNGPTGKVNLFFRDRTAKFVGLQLERQP
jgi:replicative DNA helicase